MSYGELTRNCDEVNASLTAVGVGFEVLVSQSEPVLHRLLRGNVGPGGAISTRAFF